MSLLDIRKLFIKQTGRFDLVVDTTDYVDNGANFFINAGQRFIERQLDVGRALAKYTFTLKTGKYMQAVENCRGIFEVVIENLTTKATTQLVKNADLLGIDITAVTAGQPTEYVPAIERKAPQSYPIGWALSDQETRVIIFNCPADMNYSCVVTGMFTSPTLEKDKDESYWSQVHPEILLQAALYRLEVFYRNKTGADDIVTPLLKDISDLDKDEVAQEIANITQIAD